MLVYVDESYKEAKTPNAKSTFAGACLSMDRYREFDTDFFKLKKHFWKITAPYELELKGRLLLSERAIELPKNREFIRQLLALLKEYNVVPFAVVGDGLLSLKRIKDDHLPDIYRALLRRIDRFVSDKYPQDQAIIFFDGVDYASNEQLAISFNNYMFRHFAGMQYKHVLPVPNFSNSLVTPGIQIADVIAYCVNERYVGRRGHLEEFFQQFRELSYTPQDPDAGFALWGFKMIGTGLQQTEEGVEAEEEAELKKVALAEPELPLT